MHFYFIDIFFYLRKVIASLAGENQDESNTDVATRQTAQDFEDACNEELSKFKPGSKITGTYGKKKDRMVVHIIL